MMDFAGALWGDGGVVPPAVPILKAAAVGLRCASRPSSRWARPLDPLPRHGKGRSYEVSKEPLTEPP